MTRRTALLAVLAGLLAAFPLGCGDGDTRSDAQLRGVRLAAVIKGLDNPFFVTMRDGLVAAARHNGARLKVAAAPAGLQDTAG
jgi:ribose transport system substrate-binding protein